ncbi:MAG: BtpA/SgcQ family protein [Cyanobacteria bacterium J06642_11]
MELKSLFKTSNPVIGVVHLLPLPTSARWQGSLSAVVERAVQEAVALASGGVHGIVVENFFDAPFTKGAVDPAVVSAMTVVITRLRQLITVPIGINVLRNDAHSGLAIAACTGAQFIRVNVLTGVMATDQGLIEGDAHSLMRYRRELGAEVKVFADVLVKHATPVGCLTSKTALADAVADTIHRGLADAVIVSGVATGQPPTIQDLRQARSVAGDTPVFIGSGATVDNIAELMQVANGVIVSSSLKRWGNIEQPIDPNRVGQFMDALAIRL